MKRLLILMTMLLISGCDSGPNACIYTTANETFSCLQKTSSSKSDFKDACKKILTLNRLKYKDMTMGTGEACPVSPSATCRNALANLADRVVYNLDSEERVAMEGRVCNTMKGNFVVH